MALVSRARGTFYGQRTGGAPHRRAVFIGFGPLAGGAAGARERSLKSSHFVAPLCWSIAVRKRTGRCASLIVEKRGRGAPAQFSAARSSNCFPLKFPPRHWIERVCWPPQSTLPDTSGVLHIRRRTRKDPSTSDGNTAVARGERRSAKGTGGCSEEQPAVSPECRASAHRSSQCDQVEYRSLKESSSPPGSKEQFAFVNLRPGNNPG